MNTKYKHYKQMKAVASGAVKHPTKKSLVLLDGDVNNITFNNLGWAAASEYAFGHPSIRAKSTADGAALKRKKFNERMKDAIAAGTVVPIKASGTYPVQKNEAALKQANRALTIAQAKSLYGRHWKEAYNG